MAFTTKDPVDFLTDGQAFGARGRVAYNSADEGWTEGLAFAGRSGSLSGLLAYTRRDNQETENQGESRHQSLHDVVLHIKLAVTSAR